MKSGSNTPDTTFILSEAIGSGINHKAWTYLYTLWCAGNNSVYKAIATLDLGFRSRRLFESCPVTSVSITWVSVSVIVQSKSLVIVIVLVMFGRSAVFHGRCTVFRGRSAVFWGRSAIFCCGTAFGLEIMHFLLLDCFWPRNYGFVSCLPLTEHVQTLYCADIIDPVCDSFDG